MSPGLCILDVACVGFDRQAQAPAIATRNLCNADAVLGGEEIALLAVDYFDLAQLMPKGGRAPDTQSVRLPPASKPPINLGIDALMRHVAALLIGWEAPVRRAAGLPARVGPVRQGYAVQRAAHCLAARVDVLAGLPASEAPRDVDMGDLSDPTGVQALLALRALHRRCRHVLGLTTLVVQLPGDCSGCGAPALRRTSGSDTVWCGHCQRRWTYEEYTRYVELMIANPDSLRLPGA